MITSRELRERLPARFLTIQMTLAALILMAPSGIARDRDEPAIRSVSDVVKNFEERSKQGLSPGYSETRHYVLRNARFGRQAEMNVTVIHGPNGALDFSVLQVSGSEQIFKRILEGEAAVSRLPQAERSIRSSNYDFQFAGTEKVSTRNCYVLQLVPRRKSKYLLEGRVWIDTATFGLVKLEGRPTESVSLWVGKPLIVQEFEQLNGVWVAARTHTTSATRLLGTTELSIESKEQKLLREPTKVAEARNVSGKYR